jgi:hypothetical protein
MKHITAEQTSRQYVHMHVDDYAAMNMQQHIAMVLAPQINP